MIYVSYQCILNY
uniref:Uncharacterized protein n=1 Tax=Arundo donax TaxID=35708 RepID=A0A0A8YVU9_ARUDO